MKTTIKELIKKLQKLDSETTIDFNYLIIEKCPKCNSDKNVSSFNGYGFVCSKCGSFGRN